MIAKAYDIDYMECENSDDIQKGIDWLLDSKETCILELNVDRDAFTSTN